MRWQNLFRRDVALLTTPRDAKRRRRQSPPTAAEECSAHNPAPYPPVEAASSPPPPAAAAASSAEAPAAWRGIGGVKVRIGGVKVRIGGVKAGVKVHAAHEGCVTHAVQQDGAEWTATVWTAEAFVARSATSSHPQHASRPKCPAYEPRLGNAVPVHCLR